MKLKTSSPESIGTAVGNFIIASIKKTISKLNQTMNPGQRLLFRERIENDLRDLLYMLTVFTVENKFGLTMFTDEINIKILNMVFSEKDLDDIEYWGSDVHYGKISLKNGNWDLREISKRFNRNIFDMRKEKYFDVNIVAGLLLDFVTEAREMVGKYEVR